MNTPFFELDQPANYLSLIFLLVLFVVVDAFFWFLFRRVVSKVMLYVSEALGILFWGFGLIAPALVCFSAIGVETIVLFLANPNENRDYISNNMVGKAQRIQLFRRRKVDPESLFDRDAVYRKVQSAVITMSKQKVGAIISFEKKDSLDEVMKSGTRIDAPVSAELLQTIFYPGTRLHDGAVIIRDGRIAAAGCMLPLSNNNTLSHDLGMRHRAGVGISEHSDAVVAIVSEETGAISVAINGMMKRHLDIATFEAILRAELMEDEDQPQKPAERLAELISNLMGKKDNEESETERHL